MRHAFLLCSTGITTNVIASSKNIITWKITGRFNCVNLQILNETILLNRKKCSLYNMGEKDLRKLQIQKFFSTFIITEEHFRVNTFVCLNFITCPDPVSIIAFITNNILISHHSIIFLSKDGINLYRYEVIALYARWILQCMSVLLKRDGNSIQKPFMILANAKLYLSITCMRHDNI